MSIDKDDNDNEQKNIDTYKVLGDQMARLALNFENKEKTDENSFLITYDDLAGKVPNLNPNPSLKTGGEETKNKGKVKFSQVIKANPPSNKIETKKSGNKNKNILKQKIDNKQNDSEKKLPFINPSFKNSNINFNVNSITNANTNSSRDKININNNINQNINSTNMNNSNYININNNDNNNKLSNRNSNKNSTKNILRTNSNFSNNKNNSRTNTNQANFSSKNFISKP